MEHQTDTDQANTGAHAPGEKRWSRLSWGMLGLGAGLYLLDQISKMWIVHHFPLNYINEKAQKYLFLPDFSGYQRVSPEGIVDLFVAAPTRSEIPPLDGPPLPEHTTEAIDRLRDLEPMSFFDGALNITRVHNTGVAFGMGNGTAWSSYLFLAIPVVAIIVLIILYRKNLFRTIWQKIAYVLLLAGVAGNLTDRLVQGFLLPYDYTQGFFTKLMNGYVVDFIDVTIPWFNYRWPAFNVADSCICIAAVIFFISSFQSVKKNTSTQPEPS